MLADLNGNNRLDTLENVVRTTRVGLLFLVPGSGEALRINGRAWVTIDPEVLDLFADDIRRPVSAIGVEVTEAYVHCAKAGRRAGLWDPNRWPELDRVPSGARMLRAPAVAR